MFIQMIFSEWVNFFAAKLGLVVQYHKPERFMEKLDFVFKVKVTARFQNVNESLSRLYLLKR